MVFAIIEGHDRDNAAAGMGKVLFENTFFFVGVRDKQSRLTSMKKANA